MLYWQNDEKEYVLSGSDSMKNQILKIAESMKKKEKKKS
jgi:hypothetical protein